MSKIVLGASFATGYVLGARAGRERYDQIQGQAQRLWGNPTVQAQMSTVSSAVEDALPDNSGESASSGPTGSSDSLGSGSTPAPSAPTGETSTSDTSAGRAHAGSPSGSGGGSRRSRGRRSRRGPRPEAPPVATAEDVLHDEDPLVYSTGPAVTATAEELAADEPGR